MTTMNPATRRLIKVHARGRRPAQANASTCCWGITWQGARSISRKTAITFLDACADLHESRSRGMAPRNKQNPQEKDEAPDGRTAEACGSWAAETRGQCVEQPICDTLERNYMPYAMSVIVSRAIPEIDGFKPSHRKLLYTMYKMGLLNGERTKSANIVGADHEAEPPRRRGDL